MERLYGFRKVGYCKDLPAGRGPRKGVYSFEWFATDPKVEPWVIKMFRPFVYETMADFSRLHQEYTMNNLKRCKEKAASFDLKNS